MEKFLWKCSEKVELNDNVIQFNFLTAFSKKFLLPFLKISGPTAFTCSPKKDSMRDDLPWDFFPITTNSGTAIWVFKLQKWANEMHMHLRTLERNSAAYHRRQTLLVEVNWSTPCKYLMFLLHSTWLLPKIEPRHQHFLKTTIYIRKRRRNEDQYDQFSNEIILRYKARHYWPRDIILFWYDIENPD